LRFIQDSRKTANLDVSDRIKMTYSTDTELQSAIEQHKERIMHDALIKEMSFGSANMYSIEIEGHSLSINIEKI